VNHSQATQAQATQAQTTQDWPSERFESLWREVAAAAPSGVLTAEKVASLPVISRPVWGDIPAGAWLHISGKLEQCTPLGTTHPDGQEWFVRDESGDPIAVYAMTTAQYRIGSVVTILGRDAGVIRLADRQGIMREYQAVIGVPMERSAMRELVRVPQVTTSIPSGLISIAAVVALIGAWIWIRWMLKRSAASGSSRIRSVADHARAQSTVAISTSLEPTPLQPTPLEPTSLEPTSGERA